MTESGDGGTLPPKVILLVEDDVDSAEMLSFALESAGYSVIWASTGQAALEVFGDPSPAADAGVHASMKPDLILLDLSLPDIDGAEVARRLQGRLDETPPIIVSSGRTDESLRRVARATGAASIARKPFSIHGLLETIQILLMRGARGPAGALPSEIA